MKPRLHLILCAVLLAGCLNPADKTPPAPVPVSLDGASRQAIVDYSSGMADLCDSTAADIDAGKFKAQSQITDKFHAASQAIREDAFGKLGKQMDAVVPPGVNLSPAETAAAYRLMAKGFRRIGK